MAGDASKNTASTVDAIYRAESRRVLATLIRLLGDFDLAEEALHEAFRAALEHWPEDGLPDNPRAWLVSTGRFKAIDAIRRRARFDPLDDHIEHVDSLEAEAPDTDPESVEDDRLRLVGTSLTAVEIAKITRSLDVLLKRPEVDPKRVGMVGLSYGGYYTLVTMALEPRIRAGVSSCYFGVQEGRYAQDELSVPGDFRFPDRFTLLNDPEVAALICPRPLEIQAGSRDNASHRETGRQIAPSAS